MVERLGAFQFHNLVQSHVPFLFVHDGVPFAETYKLLEKHHLERWSFVVDFSQTQESFLSQIRERQIPKTVPVVLISKGSSQLQTWGEVLVAQGFLNTYFYEGSWEKLLSEREG